MSIGRNDPCPCGSGKKYKKCCMKNEVVIELQEHFLEQFYRQKETLVEKLINYIAKESPYNEYQQLRIQFNEKVGSSMQDDQKDDFFHFWMYFLHRFDNGLRGIEWYYKENKNRLDDDELEMTKRWTTLAPRLLQAVNKTHEVIIFEDVITKEQFTVASDEENLPHFLPWMSTFALLEPFQYKFYFNGVRAFVGPDDLRGAEIKVRKLMTKTDQSYEQVCMEYYLEILVALFTDETVRDIEEMENKLTEYTLTYEMVDEVIVLEYLRSHPEFRIDMWKKEKKTLSWLSNWRAYEDSELQGVVKLADVNGIFEIEKKHVSFKSYDGVKTKQMKEILNELSKQLLFIEEIINEVDAFGIQAKNYAVSMEKNTPPYFALYAQNALMTELDEPIPLFQNQSLRQLAKNQPEDAETWLKESEYMLYRTIIEQVGKVEVTADFNTVRKELGLPLSKFVTGGDSRRTNYQSTNPEVTESITEDDIPYLEKLGFTPQTIDHFYTIDIVRFFKERTIGKSETTERKYRNSLYELREILEQDHVNDWEQCDFSFWKKVITEEYAQANDLYSKTEWNDFLSTVKTFITWLNRINKISNIQETLLFIKNMDSKSI